MKQEKPQGKSWGAEHKIPSDEFRKEQTMKKAAIYARYSSENQRNESIDAQISAIEEYAKRNNIIIVATYIDRAKSATTADRPSFQEMIKMSETGLFDTIIVHKLDRFARSKYDSAIYKQKLKVNNVQLLSATENLDGTPESIILESVLEAMAEYYSKNLAREIMKGNMENAKRAVHCGGIPPLGYDIKDKKLIINEHEAEAVRIIFEMYADGCGYSEIIKTLNKKGYKTKLGKSFGKNSLFEILRNEKYKGIYTYNKSSHKTSKGTYNRHCYKSNEEVIRIENGCPQIISAEIFEKVQKRQEENKRIHQHNRDRQKYLLSGLVFCGKCGSAMHANRRRKNSQLTFRCNRKSQTISCNTKEINMAYLENYVLDELQRNIFSFSKVSEIMKLIDEYMSKNQSEQINNAENIKKELDKLAESRNNIIKAIENGIYKEHFSNILTEIKQQEEFLKSKLLIVAQPKSFRITKDNIILLIDNFKNMRSKSDFVGLRKIVKTFVDKIEVTNSSVTLKLKLNFDDINISSKTFCIPKDRLKEQCISPSPIIKKM